MTDPLSNQDVATKNYVGKNAITIDDDIQLNVGTDLVRNLGCNDLSEVYTSAGVRQKYANVFHTQFRITSAYQIKTDVGFAILINELPICVFGRDAILCGRSIDMDQHLIKNVKNPTDRLDAVNNTYADRIKYKTVTGNNPNNVMTDHTLFTFPAEKAFASGEIKIRPVWVERLADEWIATSSPMFATEWPGFHKFSRGPSFMTFFTGSRQWLDSHFSPRLYRTSISQFK